MLTEKTKGIWISELIGWIPTSEVQNYILYLQDEIRHGLLRILLGC